MRRPGSRSTDRSARADGSRPAGGLGRTVRARRWHCRVQQRIRAHPAAVQLAAANSRLPGGDAQPAVLTRSADCAEFADVNGSPPFPARIRHNATVLLNELVRTSAAVADTRARRAKIAEIAALLATVPADEVPVAVAFLSGELRQRQIGVGYAALGDLTRPDGPGGQSHRSLPPEPPAGQLRAGPPKEPAPATPPGVGRTGRSAAPAVPTLTLAETDAAFAAIGAITGQGAHSGRRRLLAALLDRATDAERAFLTRLLAGDLRQGALEGVMSEAIARAAGVPADLVRRAHQLGGSLPEVAQAALSGRGSQGSPDPGRASAALLAVKLRVGRPLRPMLAASAASIGAALDRISPAAVEWKIDGIRIQVHRNGDEVAVFTRTLDDITARVPEIASAVLALDLRTAVLDGEAVALFPDGRPRPFQVTSGRAASQESGGRQHADVPLTPFFFDLLHLDGADLIDLPSSDRIALLARVAPAVLVIPRTVTADLAAAEAFFRDAVDRGHEGVVVKSLDGLYAAGRRGSEWIKVKPRHTLDLVVLAAEWGHGRRRGWLSNLHLGARDPATGGLVMLGKTFKGLTDEMLAWQTTRLLELADPPLAPGAAGGSEHGVVRVRPELVVEIAFDGVQSSSRYPGGVALRFARVLRYRPDKAAAEADTIEAVRAVWGQGEPPAVTRP
jgi:ATP-dependent DNA ligase I